jgi:hypothetical protein
MTDLQATYLAVTALFILTGFLYNLLYFGLFNIRVELFFTLQDYLASSIEKVYLIIISILLALAGSSIARFVMREKKQLLQHRVIIASLYIAPAMIFAAGWVLLQSYHEPLGYFVLSFAAYIASDFVLFKAVFKSNHDSYSRYFYLSAFILYILLVISTAIYNRDVVLNKPVHSLKHYRFHFTQDLKIDPENSIVLEASSNYYFFYDKRLEKVYVVSKEYISYIEASL